MDGEAEAAGRNKTAFEGAGGRLAFRDHPPPHQLTWLATGMPVSQPRPGAAPEAFGEGWAKGSLPGPPCQPAPSPASLRRGSDVSVAHPQWECRARSGCFPASLASWTFDPFWQSPPRFLLPRPSSAAGDKKLPARSDFPKRHFLARRSPAPALPPGGTIGLSPGPHSRRRSSGSGPWAVAPEEGPALVEKEDRTRPPLGGAGEGREDHWAPEVHLGFGAQRFKRISGQGGGEGA